MTPLLQLENFSVSFPIYGGIFGRKIGEVRAVQDVSFTIQRGETTGLVGESGCGKSSLGKSILRLIPSTEGRVIFQGTDLSTLSKDDLQKTRRRMQIIFQDPFSSLNPRMKVGEILREPYDIHRLHTPAERKEKVFELLNTVGLRPESFDKYPHEFSGGQRQRIGIARAIAVKPDFIVADEPVSALDVSIQSQILNLLRELQTNFKLTYLFISHDLNVIRYLCDRVVVMYLGRVMEILTRDQLLDPQYKKHPYTEALIQSAPKRHPRERRAAPPLQGDIPSPVRPPSGCVFHTRCPEVKEICKSSRPPLQGEVACHFRENGRLVNLKSTSGAPT